MPAYPGRGGPSPAVRLPTGEFVPPQAPSAQPVSLPWWLYEPQGSVDWETNAINFVPTVSATSNITDFGITVPEGFQSVLSQIAITVNTVLTTTSLNFALYIDGAPVTGWNKIRIPPISATAFLLPFNGMVVLMTQNNKLTAKVTEGTGVSYTCSMQGRGWHVANDKVAALMGTG